MKNKHQQRGLRMTFLEFCDGLGRRARFLRDSRALHAREERSRRYKAARTAATLSEIEPSEVDLKELEVEEKDEE